MVRRTLKRLTTLLLLGAAGCWAQTFVTQPVATNISHASARVTFLLSTSPNDADVQWGPGFSKTTKARVGGNPVVATVLLMGLTPATTYTLRARMNSGSIVSNTMTFTTQAEPTPHPSLPLPPVVPDVAPPPAPPNSNEFNPTTNTSGRRITIAADCSDLSTKLGWLASSLPATSDTFEMVIPVGTTCEGQYTFPPRANHTGWFHVRSSAVGTSAFPPDGVRWTTDWPVSTTLATFQTNLYPIDIEWQASSYWTASTDCHDNGENGIIGLTLSYPYQTADFRVIECRTNWPSYAGPTTVTNVTGTAPFTVTAPGHQLQNGMTVRFSANGVTNTTIGYIVFNVNGNTFQITPKVGGGTFNASLNPTFSVIPMWRQPVHTEGTSNPTGSCSVADLYWNTTAAELWWCRSDGWQKYKIISYMQGPEKQAALTVGQNATKYRFTGLRFVLKDYPLPLPAGWYNNVPNGEATQGRIETTLAVSMQTSRIVFDRVYVEGKEFPYRIGYLIHGHMTDSALMNSYLGPAAWFRANGYGDAEGTIGVMVKGTSRRFLCDNNYISNAGVSYFTNAEDGWLGEDLTDFTITRNTFQMFPRWRRGDPLNNGYNFQHRNTIEFKHGQRILVEGNRFKYAYSAGLTYGTWVLGSTRVGWATNSDVKTIVSVKAGVVTTASPHQFSAGAVVQVSGTGTDHDGLWEVAANNCPVCTTLTLVGNLTGSGSGGTIDIRATGKMINDFAVRNNLFTQGTETFRITGFDDSNTQWGPPGHRYQFSNNLVVDMNLRSFANGGYVDQFGISSIGNFGAMSVFDMGYIEDLAVTNNTIFGNRGNAPSLLVLDNSSEGLRAENNLYTWDETLGQLPFLLVRGSGSSVGTAALNLGFSRDGAPSWVFRNNVLCCGLGSNSSTYPSTTQWPSSLSSVKWFRPSITQPFDFRLLNTSPYISGGAQRGTNEANSGVDVDTLENTIGIIPKHQVNSVSSSSVKVVYMAPSNEGCTVEYGTSSTWGTGTRVQDGGGAARQRTVTLTGLTSGTNYYYRILCRSDQISDTFRTP
ncbi:MAG: fibronectin type III domain-containing protein [Bryobacteraceae bacterium]